MNTIKGSVSDKETFAQTEAELLIQSGYWIIKFKNVQGHTEQLVWDEKNIISRKDSSTQYSFIDNQSPRYTFLSDDLKLILRVNPTNTLQKWIRRTPQLATYASATSILIVFIIVLWKSIPLIGSGLIRFISIPTEKMLGEKMALAFLEREVVNDTLTTLVNEYYKSLNKISMYDIHITVVHSKTVNAIAIPGGTIIIFSEILKKMKSHESLAALLGHESTHIELRHSLHSLTRSLTVGAILSLLLGTDLSTVLNSNITRLSGLKYSRSLEEAADEGGVQLMIDKKISLKGMVDLMTALEESNPKDMELEFLQSHPLTDKRLERAKEALAAQKEIVTNETLVNIWERMTVVLK